MARKVLLLAAALLLSLFALAGCNNSGSGSMSSSPAETTDASAPSAACASESPGSAAQASCEAVGVPGITEDAERCGSTTPSPIATGIIQGTFGRYCENAIASTYNTTLVPDGADATVTVTETASDTTVELIAQGFSPNTGFTATLHQSLCGAEPSAAGEEYLDAQNPQAQNLVLDFTTDDAGNSTATVTVPWLVPQDGIGRSLLVTAGAGSMSSGGMGTSSMSPSDMGTGEMGADQAAACISLEQ